MVVNLSGAEVEGITAPTAPTQAHPRLAAGVVVVVLNSRKKGIGELKETVEVAVEINYISNNYSCMSKNSGNSSRKSYIIAFLAEAKTSAVKTFYKQKLWPLTLYCWAEAVTLESHINVVLTEAVTEVVEIIISYCIAVETVKVVTAYAVEIEIVVQWKKVIVVSAVVVTLYEKNQRNCMGERKDSSIAVTIAVEIGGQKQKKRALLYEKKHQEYQWKYDRYTRNSHIGICIDVLEEVLTLLYQKNGRDCYRIGMSEVFRVITVAAALRISEVVLIKGIDV
ncbi:hypothetical protein DPMN_126361 [Dreissena polymorpha]|uniref:Uncharacterized protein n=1 Tax=Dreissena polymorpha TaxID=45954 RepID=A0A9D4JVI9_DREPO|nr:hypothetical protein DPMN_126361 [Dreissena polymorpha]